MQREIREPSDAPLSMLMDDFCVIFQAAHLLLIDNRDRMNRFSVLHHGNGFLLAGDEKNERGILWSLLHFGEPQVIV